MSVLLDALKKAADEKKARKDFDHEKVQSVEVSPKNNFKIENNEQVPERIKPTVVETKPLNEEKINLETKEEKQPSFLQIQSEPKDFLETEVEPEKNSEKEADTLFTLTDDEEEKKEEQAGSKNQSITNQLFEDVEVEVNDNLEALTLIEKENVVIDNKRTEKPIDVDESSDWSLSQIPGYQQYTDEEQKKQETKKIVKGFLLKSAESKKRVVKVGLYLILALMFLSGLAFYASFYFETERAGVNNDLRKYQLINEVPLATTKKKMQKPKLEVNKEEVKEVIKKTLTQKTETSEAQATEGRGPPENRNPAIKVIKKSKQLPKKTIKKNKIVIKKEPQDDMDKKAFIAYEKGDYIVAKQFYQKSLKENARNILALSGLGAIAVKNGNLVTATGYYQKILQADRNNYQVKQALLSLSSNGLEKKGVLHKIQKEIIKNPNDPALKFVLGNYYAQKTDWVLAQKHYFSAATLDLENQVYALNLAISMDKLGMHEQALQFYKKSIELADIQGNKINTAPVKNRIRVLVDFIKGND